MTPMHILALNPHATSGAILTLFHANMGAVFEPYAGYGMSDKTPLDCLMEFNTEAYLGVIAALCIHQGQE